MEKEKKLIEYRFYEMPTGHYVLALIGDKWEMHYGSEPATMLHFHNFLEIGYCYWGNGMLTIEDTKILYRGGITTLIPPNIPHTTNSAPDDICKWEFLFIDIENFVRHEMPSKRLSHDEIIKKINHKAHVVSWSKNKNLSVIVKNILDEYRMKKPYYKEAVNGYLLALITEILRTEEEIGSATTAEEHRLSKIIGDGVSYIKDHFSEDIKVADVADFCGLSESHFRRIFEDCLSMKPLDYVNMIRIDRACSMLEKEEYSVEEVGVRVGYQTPSTFTRNFKKLTGQSPLQWKKTSLKTDGNKKNYKISAKRGW